MYNRHKNLFFLINNCFLLLKKNFTDPETGNNKENDLLLPAKPNGNTAPSAKKMKLCTPSVLASTPTKTSKVLGNYFLQFYFSFVISLECYLSSEEISKLINKTQ